MAQQHAKDPVDDIQNAWLRERPETPVASIGVITRLWHAAKLLGEDRRRTLLARGVDSATLDLLSTLRRAGTPYRMKPRELRESCLVTIGAISQRLARAEAEGLIHARRGQGGRIADVELTDAGHSLVEDVVDKLLRHEQQLLAHLTEDKQENLSDLLRELLSGLLDTLDGESRPGHVGHLDSATPS